MRGERALKEPCLVAGMAAGADSIDDMGLLRHGAMSALFGGVRAPSTLGSHLRCYTWGNVAQLEKAGREFLIALAGQSPLLPGADVLAFIDIDSTQKRVYGHKKQGARFGHTKIQGTSLLVRGLNALAAVVSTPLSAPVIAATRLRGGNAASARGAASLAVRAIGTARDCGCTGTLIVRLDSAFYNAAVIGAVRRADARFSVTVPMNSSIRAAIAAIGEDAWTPIRYPRAIWDDQLQAWISDAGVAEAEYTAFASKKDQAVTARLVVRRVRDLNKKAADGQDELFPVWRYHAVFTVVRTASFGSDPYFVTVTSPCGGMRRACNDQGRSGARSACCAREAKGLLVGRRLSTPAALPGVQVVIVAGQRVLVMLSWGQPGRSPAAPGRGRRGGRRGRRRAGADLGAGPRGRRVVPPLRPVLGTGAQRLRAPAGRRAGRRPAGDDPAGGAPVLLRQPGLRGGHLRRAG